MKETSSMFTKRDTTHSADLKVRSAPLFVLGLGMLASSALVGPATAEAQPKSSALVGPATAEAQPKKLPVFRPIITRPILEITPVKPPMHPAFAAKLQDPARYRVGMARGQESSCGEDDTQHVRDYDGTLGQTRAFVDRFKGPVGRLRTVENCTGTLIARNLFLTASHCVDALATQNKVVFNDEKLAGDTLRTDEATEYDVVEVVEDGLVMPLDYAILRLADRSGQPNPNPGDSFGIARIEQFAPALGHVITSFQHPDGEPKVVEVGHVKLYDQDLMYYDDLDTDYGSSGAGVLDDAGRLVGVHVNGGCDEGPGNSAVRMDRLVSVSATIRGLLPPTILAKVTRIRELHVSDMGLKYGTPSDVLDVEAMLRIEGTDELFGFTLRTGTDEEAHDAMFELLRTAFQKNLPIRIEYDRETHRTNRVFRVIRN